MTNRFAGPSPCAALTAFLLVLCSVLPAAAAVSPADAALVKKSLQARGDRFVQAPGSGAKAFFANSGTQTMSFAVDGVEVRPRMASASQAKSSRPAALRYQFASAAKVAPAGVKDSGVTYNFFYGSRGQWETGLRSYSQVGYTAVWPGVDATYSGDSKGLKYHFDVAPGADAKAIRFVVSGASQARIAADGAVEWTVGGAIVRDEVPVAYQSANGADQIVPAAFRLEAIDASTWSLAIDVGAYDRAKALTVDPAWTAFAGLVGGNASDQVYAVARDDAGATYACGITASADFPTRFANDASANGEEDAFIVKFDQFGALSTVTYFGGSGYDVCTGIAVGSADSVYVTGGTTSTNFPFLGSDSAGRFRRSKSTADRDAFVAKFNSSASSIGYSGLVGGAGDEQANGIALNGSSACVTGYTTSAGFPVYNSFGNGPALKGAMDAFVTCIEAGGNGLSFSMYVGGNGNLDVGRAIAVAGSYLVVVGETDSASGLPTSSIGRTVADGTDAFAAKLDSTTGTYEWFTLLGGTTPAGASGTDRALSVAADGVQIVVAGETESDNFPANNAGTRQGLGGVQNTRAGSMDGFLVYLEYNGRVTRSTYLGGSAFDSAEAVIMHSDGDLYVAGTTAGPATFPTLATGGLATTSLGGQDGFLSRLSASLSLVYSGFIGGNVGGGSINDSVHALAYRSNSTDVTTRYAISLGGATGGNSANFTGATGSAPSGSVNGMVMNITPYRGTLFLTAVSGSGQSATATNTFAQPLVAKVIDTDGNPFAGVTVTFTGPASGAGAVLTPPTATTGADGIAQTSARPNGVAAGTYSVVATAPGLNNATFTLTNALAPQTITFAQPPDKTIGDAPFTLVATTTGPGFIVSFTSDTTETCTATSGGLTILHAPGTCTITARQPGGNGWAPAPNVTRSFNIAKRAQTITFPAIAAQTFSSGGTFAVAGTSSSGLTVAFTSTTLAVCTVSGTTVTMLAAGTCIIAADQAGDGTYAAATQVTQNITINSASPTWGAPFDFNGDGKPDLLWSNTAAGSTYAWFMNGPALISDIVITHNTPNWKVQGVADFNGDGKPDIVWRDMNNGNTFVWYMDGTTLVSDALLFETPMEWVIQGVADFNGDGKPDVLLRNVNTGVALVRYYNNAAPLGESQLFAIDPVWKVDAIADFNGDTRPDLLFRNAATGLAFVWNTQYSAGTLSLAAAQPEMFSIDPTWEVVQATDWNGDTKPDLVFRNRDSGVVFVWYTNGSTLTTSDFIIQIDPSWEIAPHS